MFRISQEVGSNVMDSSGSLEHIGLVVLQEVHPQIRLCTRYGRIGTSEPDKSLVVNGDMRLGIIHSNTLFNKYGSKLFFSGGSADSLDSDNGDDLFMARYNYDDYQSHLRVNFSTINEDSTDEDGEGEGYDQFVVGYTYSSAFVPVLRCIIIVMLFGESSNVVETIYDRILFLMSWFSRR